MASVETPPTLSHTRLFTAAEYEEMCRVGIIGEDERTELLDGEIVVMNAQGLPHAFVLMVLNRCLIECYDRRYTVHPQLPIAADEYSLPEPDLAVAPGDAQTLVALGRRVSCRETLVLIEVVDTTRAMANRKASIYARACAPRYWIIDIPRRHVVVHEAPRPDGTWGQVTQFSEGQTLTLPDVDVPLAVADLLPPPATPRQPS